MVTLICEYCKNKYQVKPYRQNISRCCSRKCLWYITYIDREPNRLKKVTGKKAINNKQQIVKCKFCCLDFLKSPSRTNKKFCSRQCYGNFVSKKYLNKQKYIRITTPEGKRMHEHRYLMQIHIGRELTKNEHIHHINHDKQDNRIENLEILTISAHSKAHPRTFD